MKCTILKEFPYSHDGNQTETLKPGGEPSEIRGDLVPGLEAAGLVKRKETQSGLPLNEPVRAKPVSPENKMVAAAPENKDAPAGDEARDTVPHRGHHKKK